VPPDYVNSRLEGLVSDVVKTIKKDGQKVVTFYKTPSYQAASWDSTNPDGFSEREPGTGKARRIDAKVEQYPDELFPRFGFIVTILKWRENQKKMF
jgi:hypothetical protein